ncbi:hypothetical protein ACOMHN_052971 [Nucella lapillus]
MAVSINNATEGQMMQSLPGIGAKRAAHLIRIREREGKITPADLATVLRSQPSKKLLSLVDFGEGQKSPEKEPSKSSKVPTGVTDTDRKMAEYLVDPFHFPLLSDTTRKQDTASERELNWRKVAIDGPLPVIPGHLRLTAVRNARNITGHHTTTRRNAVKEISTKEIGTVAT